VRIERQQTADTLIDQPGEPEYYAGKGDKHWRWTPLECGAHRRFGILFSPTPRPRGKRKCQSGDARRTPKALQHRPALGVFLPCRRNTCSTNEDDTGE
jgi:hypothetical protein